MLKRCLRDPIPEIFDAARFLDAAVSAHLHGKHNIAVELLALANISVVREWTESLWGANSPHVQLYADPSALPYLADDQKVPLRMPTAAEKAVLHARDGYHCRVCGIPVIRKEVRVKISETYPNAVPWGKTNRDQHAAFQAMWAQYDHVVAHARGGTNDLDNMIITCAPCNYSRMSYTFAEVGLTDPRERPPVRSLWDGLERFR
ncbi:HNH endonuclease [Ralstonia insidiosa]|uniref:HNH endonuclease n=1 Tax=Ralstonia insidiosa TaxID=190721 RepID=A0A848P2A5_9RALS|nr:HNH endonuclease signature motif containing protein [Ralstonia insidiosa]NMV39657.1 HNH endonuclease [Ralstonia insidiosa]